jgi:tetratricopeptide (TPR) repeat protein
MIQDTPFYTQTLAKLYVRQGHYNKAIQIYKHLLNENPGDTGLIRSLNEVETKLKEIEKSGNRQSIDLFYQWIDLLNRNNCLKKLNKLQQCLKIPQ